MDDYKKQDASTKLCRINSKRKKRNNKCINTTNPKQPDNMGPTNNVTELTRYTFTQYLLLFSSRKKEYTKKYLLLYSIL